MTSSAMAAALVAAVAAVVTAGCDGDGRGGAAVRSTTTAAPSTTQLAVSPRAPAPVGYRFRSPHRYGYWFTRPPVVVVPKVGDFQHSYRVFLRLNRPLPHYRAKDGRLRPYRIDAGATVNGAGVEHGYNEVSAVAAPRPCYREGLDLMARRRADDVAVGELVTVTLRIADHPRPLTVRVPLGIASGVDDDPLEQRYLSWIGCAD